MKYYYEQPAAEIAVYGETIELNHPCYSRGTLYFYDGLGLIVVQQRFDPVNKTCYWWSVKPAIANDIYLCGRFYAFFKENAKMEDYPIFEIRMKPLPREDWEDFFGR